MAGFLISTCTPVEQSRVRDIADLQYNCVRLWENGAYRANNNLTVELKIGNSLIVDHLPFSCSMR